MKDIIFYFYGYVVFFYSLGLMVSYVILMWLAELGILRSKHSHLSVYPKYIMDNSPYTPGVSIIAPAYNEEKTIVNNVNSLLAQEYPIFEVVIVNDGSRDKDIGTAHRTFLVSRGAVCLRGIYTYETLSSVVQVNPDRI